MRNIFLLLFVFTFFANNTKAQETDPKPYLAKVLKQTSLKAEPEITSKTLLTLKVNAQIYVFANEELDGFVKVIDITTNKLGWVQKSALKKIKDLPLSQKSSFQDDGESSSYEPEVVIKNTTGLTIRLIVGEKSFVLKPHSTTTEFINVGEQLYTASAPGVIPLSGKHIFNSNSKYNWTFTLVTSRVRR